MDAIRILIADDDEGMLTLMEKLVARAQGYALVGKACDGNALMALYEEESPEVVLMDVEMPGMSGIECARIIQDKNPKTVLIFATAHEQYMKNAFEVYAFDYLVKPFRAERALNTLALVRERLQEAEKPAPMHDKVYVPQPAPPMRLMLKNREGISVVDVDSILLVQREERLTVIYTEDDGRYVTSDGMSELEQRLPANRFFRTHKSYIVNIARIASITPYGRWTSVIRLRGTRHDALITHERLDELQKIFV